MSKAYFFGLILISLVSCAPAPQPFRPPKDWRQLNVGPFKITTPPDWKFEDPGQQEDSFVGQITGPNLILSFDCSNMGYANHLDDEDAKIQNIKIDTNGNYITKTIWPKVNGRGLTGIFIRSSSSTFDFQMNGKDLSAKDEKLALIAFKTITFNK
jgi:hypothetical protein